MSRDKWRYLLSQSGFNDVAMIPENENLKGVLSNHALILAREPIKSISAQKNGSIRCAADQPGKYIILNDDGNFGNRLSMSLEGTGDVCVLVSAGNSYKRVDKRTYEINIEQPDHYQRLLTEVLRADSLPLKGVLHLRALNRPECEEDNFNSSGWASYRLYDFDLRSTINTKS